MQLQQLMSIKKKARILLPDSCVLIGIVDPTGTLEPDEIFVQTRKDNFTLRGSANAGKIDSRMEQADMLKEIGGIQQVIEGEVLVTRCPCLHPGDIRLLKCVNKPELQYLFNVVVFSSKGERPACNMMAGGDLDGDVYFVTWDRELLEHVRPENIVAPADYSKTELIKEKPRGDTIADYFVFYLARDVLGSVSNLWLVLADMYGKAGPRHPHCLALAGMASVAVDFAKHGECVSRENYAELQ